MAKDPPLVVLGRAARRGLAQDDAGATALHKAVAGGYLETTRILLDKGADANMEVRPRWDWNGVARTGFDGRRRTPQRFSPPVLYI